MADFPRAFLFHHRGGSVPGVVLPSGRAVVIEDEEFGAATTAPTLDDLIRAYPGGRVEWPGTCQASTTGALGQPLGPCVLRPHKSPVHQDTTGTTWSTRTDHPKET